MLASSLHQAISELLPTRVEFYESWLTAGRIRKDELGRARMAAVISFLRQEGSQYDAVMDRAGRCVADWMVEVMPVVERTVLRRLPRPIRVRVVLRLVARMIRTVHDGRLRALVRGGTAVVTVEGSLFCDVREPTDTPLCRFYATVIERCLESVNVSACARSSRCRAAGGRTCEFVIHIGERATRGAEDPPAA